MKEDTEIRREEKKTKEDEITKRETEDEK